MAIIYTQQTGDTRYEIRTAGRSVRLYTNGVLHTQHRPQRHCSGGVWDLLALPALALARPPRVLLLGVGGGAAVHLLREWYPGVHITGVDLNQVHLELARRFFGLQGPDLQLMHGDARQFVADYRGAPFDLLIEDLFTDSEGEPARAIEADRHWCGQLDRLVSTEGALVINTLSRRQLQATALLAHPALRKRWQSACYLTLPAYENVVGVLYRKTVSPAGLRAAIRRRPQLATMEKSGYLSYCIHGL
ncbi:MAG TPA: methyltransferase domain-containing protein [Pseudomonadaceae bacterium]|nr:methyltransferase domain-containing protein [Pseudomonadaceae bacterium]